MTRLKKSMERISSFLMLFMAAVLISNTSAQAAYQRVSGKTFTASGGVSITGTGTVDLNVAFKTQAGAIANPATDATATSVQWTGIDIDANPKPKWVKAQTYVVVESTLTNGAGGIQIYTDNTNVGGEFGVEHYEGTSNPAGLFASNFTKETPLSTAWRVSDSALAASKFTGIQQVSHDDDGIPNNGIGEGDHLQSADEAGYRSFLWMLDLKTPENVARAASGSADDLRAALADYSKIVTAGLGYQTAEATYFYLANPNFLYFIGNFENAVSGRDYISNIVVEAFTE